MNKNIKALIMVALFITNSAMSMNNPMLREFDRMAANMAANIEREARLNRERYAAKVRDAEREKNEFARGQEAYIRRYGQAAYDEEMSTHKEKIDDIKNEGKNTKERLEKWEDVATKGVDGFIKIGLDSLQEEALNKREALKARTKQREANKGKMEQMKEVLKKENLMKVGGFLALSSVGIASGYYLSKLMYNYLLVKMNKPRLIRRTSVKTPMDKIRNYFFPKEDNVKLLQEIMFEPVVEAQLHELAKGTKKVHEHGLPFRNLLMYGPPGTGKTAFAEKMCEYADLDFGWMSGADFSQFSEAEGVQEINNLFAWGNKTNGLVIFIDEVDSFLGNRKNLDSKGKSFVNCFLSHTGDASNKIMFIFATNNPEDLDPAVMSRIQKKIAILLPGKDERVRIINSYLNKLILDRDGESTQWSLAPEINDAFINDVAEQAEGFSGRDIKQLADELPYKAVAHDTQVITQGVFNAAFYEKMKQKTDELGGDYLGKRNQLNAGRNQSGSLVAA